jgi:hypothetical protein
LEKKQTLMKVRPVSSWNRTGSLVIDWSCVGSKKQERLETRFIEGTFADELVPAKKK